MQQSWPETEEILVALVSILASTTTPNKVEEHKRLSGIVSFVNRQGQQGNNEMTGDVLKKI